ncbi:ABC transporter ATP-binding protein [Paradesulfitobacterium aromaticivorans]
MINLEQLTKAYPEGKGIRNLSLHIEPGETFGFLGPNGAGKTTTIRVLMGFLRPDSGEARIKGLDSWRRRTDVKRIVSYLPGELHFLEILSGQEFLELLMRMHGERSEVKMNWERLAQRLDLDVKQPIRKMSKGMKQKLGIISALMLDAEVLIMDEPTSGLDPLMQKVFIDLILEEKKKGKTIFMSSHQFSEIERTCERVGMIREGELLTVEEIGQLKQMEFRTFEIEVENEEDAELLRHSDFIISEEHGLRFILQAAGKLDFLWKALAEVHVKEFLQRSLELEEAFMQYYR